jgi:hypothetical protein
MANHKLHISFWENGELSQQELEFGSQESTYKKLEEFSRTLTDFLFKVYDQDGQLLESKAVGEISTYA